MVSEFQENNISERSISGPILILLIVSLVGILAVGNAFVLNAIIGRFHMLWISVSLFVEISSIAGLMFLYPQIRPAVRWRWVEVVGILVAGGIFLGHAAYLAPPDWMPVSFSVDNSHQHLLVNYVYQHNRFPEDVEYLYIYDDYPVGPSALAAFIAHVLGVLPVQTMYPLAALMVTAQVMLTYGIIAEILPLSEFEHILTLLVTSTVFFVYQYSVHIFAERFYSNTMMGNLIVLLTLWVIITQRELHPVLITGISILLVFGCLNSYPAWLPFVVIPLLASMLLNPRIAGKKRLALFSFLAISTAFMTIIATIDQWDFITWFTPSRDRRLTPSWQSLGGAFLIPACLGIGILIRRVKQYFWLSLFLICDGFIVLMFYITALTDNLSLYIPDKTFYFNIFILVVLNATGIHWIWRKLAQTRFKTDKCLTSATLIAVGLLLALGANCYFPNPSDYPITLDEYRVVYQVSQRMPNAELTYLVRNSTTFYWMYGCILNHTHNLTTQNKKWRVNTPTYETWMQDNNAPQKAIVSNLDKIPHNERWRVIIQSGKSGVIEKAP
jgi:hypothetical protein